MCRKIEPRKSINLYMMDDNYISKSFNECIGELAKIMKGIRKGKITAVMVGDQIEYTKRNEKTEVYENG